MIRNKAKGKKKEGKGTNLSLFLRQRQAVFEGEETEKKSSFVLHVDSLSLSSLIRLQYYPNSRTPAS